MGAVWQHPTHQSLDGVRWRRWSRERWAARLNAAEWPNQRQQSQSWLLLFFFLFFFFFGGTRELANKPKKPKKETRLLLLCVCLLCKLSTAHNVRGNAMTDFTNAGNIVTMTTHKANLCLFAAGTQPLPQPNPWHFCNQEGVRLFVGGVVKIPPLGLETSLCAFFCFLRFFLFLSSRTKAKHHKLQCSFQFPSFFLGNKQQINNPPPKPQTRNPTKQTRHSRGKAQAKPNVRHSCLRGPASKPGCDKGLCCLWRPRATKACELKL